MNDQPQELARQLLNNSERILLVSHIRPDGDAIGSLLALGLALQESGKEIQMVSEDGVPGSFRHLIGSDKIRKKPDGVFDLIVVLDCSDSRRVGDALKDYPTPDINIDHHPTNINYASINLVNPKATATTEMLAELIPSWELNISLPVAEALLNGLITDTLGFRTSNMTPNALRVAADLTELGADISEIYHKALNTRSSVAAKYWGIGLSKFQIEDRILWTSLTLDDRQAVNYPGRDDADLVNILTTIDDADIYVIFIEQSEERVKVSWRAKPGYDVSKIAFQFGGGGHKPAAGAEIEGNLTKVTQEVLLATRNLLNGSRKES
jgi:phosphoesterase RecJ-like protein